LNIFENMQNTRSFNWVWLAAQIMYVQNIHQTYNSGYFCCVFIKI